MRIYQICGVLSYGDGVGNVILFLEKFLTEYGYKNSIAVRFLDEKIDRKDIVIFNNLEDIPLEEDDIVIYHMAGGIKLNYEMEHVKNKKILLYHNVTTPSLFRGISEELIKDCAYGVEDAKATVGKYMKAITLSEFSKNDLVSYGWNPEDVISIPIINKNIVHYELDNTIVEEYSDGYTNFLFVGRVAPNKKFEDIIRIFGYYQKNFNSNSRLFLVGKLLFENYYNALKEYARYLEIENVNFVNFVSNEELESYYKIADVFLCMSEHEGFCIPIIEAMSREVPIVAYSSTAVKDTMGVAGILVDTKDEKVVCNEIDKILKDKEYCQQIILGQNDRIRDFNIDNHKDEIINLINEVCKDNQDEIIEKNTFADILYKENEKNKNRVEKPLVLNQELLDSKKSIVIYGLGKAGKYFYEGLSEERKKRIIAFCDERKAGEKFENISIMDFDECISNYPDAIYIVTPQFDFIEIMFGLFKQGLPEKNIGFFSLPRRRLIYREELH